MKFTFVGGKIGVIVENTVGNVHTTNIYTVPWELIAGIFGMLCIITWAVLRKRASQPK